MNNSYHNSLRLPDVTPQEQKAKTQDQEILQWLQARPNMRFTPLQVWDHFQHIDRNSVRRAMTNLATKGKIVHHEKDLIMERFGSKNSRYSYQVQVGQLSLDC